MTYNAARGTHVSPGIYTKILDLGTPSSSTTGITSLGLVGETLQGQAFVPTPVPDWTTFTTTFGGTDPSLFSGSQYPKYELPYIAQSYLQQSNQLYVTRVLGLSGYNAGPAWIIKSVGNGEGNDMIIAVIRSRGTYMESLGGITNTSCGPDFTYDQLLYQVDPNNGGSLAISPAFNENYYSSCGTGYYDAAMLRTSIICTYNDLGTFVLSGVTSNHYNNQPFSYTVSFNKGSKDYIYNVLGDANTVNGSPIFIEELYDVALSELVNSTDSTNVILGINDGVVNTWNASTNTPTLANGVGTNGAIYRVSVSGMQNLGSGSTMYTAGTYIIYNSTTQSWNSQNHGILDLINNLPISTSSGYTIFAPVSSILNKLPQLLTKSDVGKRFLWSWKYFTEANFYPQIGSVVNSQIVYSNAPYEVIVQGTWDATKAAPSQTTMNVGYAWRVINSGTTSLPGANNTTINNWSVGNLAILTKYDTTTTPGTPILEWEQMVTDGMIMVVAKDVSANGIISYNYHQSMMAFDSTTQTTFDSTFDSTFTGSVSGLTYYPEQLTTEKDFVLNQQNNLYYTYYTNAFVDRVIGDLNDYKDSYNFASTPWVVSEIKGSSSIGELIKLFRFHTITDGNCANTAVKISITNILPDTLTFNVIIRDYNDTDAYPIVLETYTNLTLNPNSKKYLGLAIGTSDGIYPAISNYVTVEITENDNAPYSVPEGFLGYPLRYLGTNINQPLFQYNNYYDSTIKANKQYFGISDIIGIDNDMFTYKGKTAYTDGILTHGFHLDSRVNSIINTNVTVDGVSGFLFDTVNASNTLSGYSVPPQLSSENDTINSIYADKNVRKFTLVPYGGFDGWDIYRTSRSNTDSFRASNYKGNINMSTGSGENFTTNVNTDLFDLPEAPITSDFYAYLAAARTFANPSSVDINVFATPGIDYVNNGQLVGLIVDMIEEERMDSIYVVTTPDKPFGYGDTTDAMYTSSEAASNLDGTNLDSLYVATYYPTCKYFDSTSNKYIFLPVTGDVVRNIALADNTAYPWFPPAGKTTGLVNCFKAKFSTKLSDEDVLYGDRINPVKTFAGDGVYIWGQKNLYTQNSFLNRLSTVRMILRLRKLIQSACTTLIFTPNDTTVDTKFKSLVTPILESIRTSGGISNYKITIDTSTEALQNLSLPAVIYIMPTGSLEYIDITFAVVPQGANFNALG